MPPEAVVAVTGAEGFIGRNLVVRLEEIGATVHRIDRHSPPDDTRARLAAADIVFHLAGANRPTDPADFARDNHRYATWVADAIAAGGRCPLLFVASSVKAGDDSAYGASKQAGEAAMLGLAVSGDATVVVYRLPNVFGKWARPNYNSAVATFCHNLARGLPITIDNPTAPVSLLYVDDLIEQWLALLDTPPSTSGLMTPDHVHHCDVGAVAGMIRGFAEGRVAGEIAAVGTGLERALYATFVSALPAEAFSYPLRTHRDVRGGFTEFVRTADSGQVSCLTAHPGVTRGGHYHHSKIEKFLVVHGEARFRFRHILTGRAIELFTSAAEPAVVETIPGWTHDITNVGEGELVALLWASERFDPARPDTIAAIP